MYLVGDIHGEVGEFKQRIRQADGANLIQVGDVGFGFGEEIPPFPDNVKVFCGNHDDPAVAKSHPNWLGEHGEFIFPNGEHGFFVSGAFSVDKAWRTPNVTWWEGEELSQYKLDAAIKEYAKIKPQLVISHECPSQVSDKLLAKLGLIKGEYAGMKLECKNSRTAIALQTMFEIHQPKEWVFGHYHFDWTENIKPNIGYAANTTKFTCLGIMTMKEFNAVY